jgi:hypothetical protein
LFLIVLEAGKSKSKADSAFGEATQYLFIVTPHDKRDKEAHRHLFL